MGYGKNLKDALDAKNMSVKELDTIQLADLKRILKVRGKNN